MTRRSDEEVDRLEQILAEVHRSRPDPVLGPKWAQQIMREIRRGAASRRQPIRSTRIEGVVWRAALIAVMLAMIVTGSAMFYVAQDGGLDAASASDELETVMSLIE